FTVANVAALYCSYFGQDLKPNFTKDERYSGARGLLKSNIQNDGEHLKTRSTGGLHPSYIDFHAKHNSGVVNTADFLADTSGDIFDALTLQDRLDGGISVLLRCPGAQAYEDMGPDDVGIYAYITPRELKE
ncbi:hypothetical protein BJ138DRAFT_990881, partial [Hygrophoropsis aurantiaca]